MGTLIMIGQVLLALGILVGLHEAGHMIAAKAFGMRVEKFSIGFPPKVFSFKKGETEYSLGLIPLGGFVKITGMMDESFDKDSLDKEPEPYEFRAKPAWQRLIVMMGGIIVNIITGIIIFIFSVYIWGKQYTPVEVMKDGIHSGQLGDQIGLKNGDRIIALNGLSVDEYSSVESLKGMDALLVTDAYYTVVRGANNDTLKINIPGDLLSDIRKKTFWDVRKPFEVGRVLPDFSWSNVHKIERPANQMGLKEGDDCAIINGAKIQYFDQFLDTLKNNKRDTVRLKVYRNKKEILLTGVVDTAGHLGFKPLTDRFYKVDTTYYSFGSSIGIGTVDAFNVLWSNMIGIKKMITGEINARESLSGPIGIAKMFGSEWRWDRFWGMTGLLSMILAFMNFLPIPALDGGHVMFLLYEMISGRAPSVKFMDIALKIGIVILISIMVFAFGNDIIRLITG